MSTDAPAEIWLRPNPTWESYYVTVFPDQPDAVEYVRRDVVEPSLRAALEALEDDDAAGAELILRTCLSRL